MQAETRFELDEIIVSGNYQNQTVEQLPKSIAVITAADIEQAPSNNLIELLAREANVNFNSFTATDKFAGIDIRGMGEVSHSNVVIMLDGVRLNAADLSGADLSSIPLSQIKRIEIIRGASAVRYGGGAVGGVINIITDPQSDQNRSNIYMSGGSFNTFDTRASTEQAFDNFSLNANIAYYDTDGYRDNGQLEKQDAKLTARFYASDHITFKTSIKAHYDEYGLPGPVNKTLFEGSNEDRKSTNSASDGGTTDDIFYNISAEIDLVNAGFLQINLSHRQRENPFLIGLDPGLTYQQQQQKLWKTNEDATNIDIFHEFNMGSTKLAYGLNHYKADFNQQKNGTTLLDQSKKRNGDVSSSSLFFTTNTPLSEKLNISTGYRKNHFKTSSTDMQLVETCETVLVDTQIEISPGIFVPAQVPIQTNCNDAFQTESSENSKWTNSAIELGVLFKINSGHSTYLNLSKSYRNPNTDELVLSDDNLKPQTGLHFDTGLRSQISDNIESSVNLFMMQIKDEIRYGVNTETSLSENHNATEKTIRKGLETDFKYYPVKSVYLWTSLAYTKSEFKESKNTIPLVPQTTLSLGLEWTPVSTFTFSLSGSYIDEQLDGLGNQYTLLNAYQVYNSKFIYRFKNINLFAGINNISNEVYSTIAFAEYYYPMPERNYYAGLSISF